MSTTVSVQAYSTIKAVKTPSGADPGDQTLTFTSQSDTSTLNSGTTVTVSKESKFTVTLSGGAYTLDLTQIPDDVNGTFDATGLKVQFLRLAPSSGNANKVTVSQGASNAYRLDGATNWSWTGLAGQVALFEGNNGGEAVGGSHKNIDFAGTGSQTVAVHIVLG
jgi:hypothetical protein